MSRRILHIIYSLEKAGAEETLAKLVINDHINNHRILTLTGGDYYLTNQIEKESIKVYSLNIKKNLLLFPLYLIRSLKIIREEKVSIIHSWMYVSDVFSSLLGFIANKEVIWCVRNTTLRIGGSSLYSIFSRFIQIPLSYISPNKIIYCSLSAKSLHEKMGFNKRLSVHIPNGINTELFKPINKRILNYGNLRIGMPARFDEQKNHILLLETIHELIKNKINPTNIKFILAGRDVNYNNLKNIYKKDLDILLPYIGIMGEVKDMNKFYNSIDFCIVCSSYGEAFPNVIAEAMATGAPCISTDVGDAKLIIGDTGFIVNGYEPINLFQTLLYILGITSNLFSIKSKMARVRIKNNFSQENMIKKYQELYSKI
ncbi:glycosyltransferase [Prochlorococcus marinus str. MIT 9312]|uniref:Glycosyltransferase n=1 Tax=Prochlorococcus marinus (strain MIT 9312) TaxID=74546 RepID=Q319R3_PROM9|nr:glycosyltransferase [Prochlorococcus marinus]ABB50382.1 glycosyltransferase [Prochlorococcus marinus str. MIT 9312]KGF99976.1 Glycosyltransferase [Prochlorococcus marinus str. MIT 9311]